MKFPAEETLSELGQVRVFWEPPAVFHKRTSWEGGAGAGGKGKWERGRSWTCGLAMQSWNWILRWGSPTWGNGVGGVGAPCGWLRAGLQEWAAERTEVGWDQHPGRCGMQAA